MANQRLYNAPRRLEVEGGSFPKCTPGFRPLRITAHHRSSFSIDIAIDIDRARVVMMAHGFCCSYDEGANAQ